MTRRLKKFRLTTTPAIGRSLMTRRLRISKLLNRLHGMRQRQHQPHCRSLHRPYPPPFQKDGRYCKTLRDCCTMETPHCASCSTSTLVAQPLHTRQTTARQRLNCWITTSQHQLWPFLKDGRVKPKFFKPKTSKPPLTLPAPPFSELRDDDGLIYYGNPSRRIVQLEHPGSVPAPSPGASNHLSSNKPANAKQRGNEQSRAVHSDDSAQPSDTVVRATLHRKKMDFGAAFRKKEPETVGFEGQKKGLSLKQMLFG